jgi:hypothetical protein
MELKKRKRKRKAQKVSSNKGEINNLRGERRFNFKNPFRCDLIFSPFIIPFQKPFLKSLIWVRSSSESSLGDQ